MNHKILKFIKQEGFCCLWAWLEIHRQVYTSDLAKQIEGICTERALQQRRAQHRAGRTKCENCEGCLYIKVRDGHMTVERRDKDHGSDESLEAAARPKA